MVSPLYSDHFDGSSWRRNKSSTGRWHRNKNAPHILGRRAACSAETIFTWGLLLFSATLTQALYKNLGVKKLLLEGHFLLKEEVISGKLQCLAFCGVETRNFRAVFHSLRKRSINM